MSRRSNLTVKDVLRVLDTDDSDFDGCEPESGDDDEDEFIAIAGAADSQESSSSDDDSDFNTDDDLPLAGMVPQQQKKRKKSDYLWRTKDFDPPDTTFKGDQVTYPANFDIPTPYEYFRTFITDDMLELCVEQTNIYSVEKSGKSANLSTKELEKVLGMFLRMGLYQMSGNRAYWEEESRFGPVADVMGRNRFSYLLTVLHFVDNNKVTEEKKVDKIWKVRPWVDMFRNKCRSLVPSEKNSIDEQMIPFKGKRCPFKQYIKGKPHPWGLKVWARSSDTGLLFDFDVYQGGTGKKTDLGMGGDVIVKLCETLPKHQNYKVVADNLFTSIALAEKLLDDGILYVGTVRKNRLGGCPLDSDKDMEAKGRGSIDSKAGHHVKGARSLSLSWARLDVGEGALFIARL
ncbi:hypothetical protein SNE40_023576 [Patella caerulea]|uniref:PiggyBac transposable element-derived protein domain-containing protein n=1 Tax=Patella caerulea TaxID=87958 RepID=A0AAN8FW64_PATCE